MFSATSSSSRISRFAHVSAKLLKSKLDVIISTSAGSRIVPINALFSEAKEANKAIIFTFTPGPFKSKEELPADWMKTSAAIGCSAQLTAFEKNIKSLNALIYAVNKHSCEYHRGSTGLLTAKTLDNLLMISDDDGSIEEELNLPTLTVNGKKYLERFSLAVKPTGEAQLFEISSPVNDEKANKHIEDISAFITPQLKNENKNGITM